MTTTQAEQNQPKDNSIAYLKQCKHGTFALLQHDLISFAMQKYGEWAEKEIELFEKIVSPGDQIFEVGSHIGSHTVPLAKLVEEIGRVYCFEPQLHPFQALNSNILINSLRNVRAYPYALGAKLGTVKLKQHDFSESVNSGAFVLPRQIDSSGEWGEVITLDAAWIALGKPKIRFIKIDVEGMEPDVWHGATECIKACKPVLFLGSHFWKYENGETPAEAFYSEVKTAGYSLFWFCPKGFSSDNHNGSTDNFLGDGGDINIVAYPAGELPKITLQPFINYMQIKSGKIDWL